jgi:uncharacterized protein YggT (Ycf19 family)
MSVLDYVDFALNCAALLLWLNWRSRGLTIPRAAGIALVSTLRRAEPAQRDRWISPATLAAILFVRAFVYWQMGPGWHWTPRLSMAAITVPFRSDNLGRMLLFSLLSFLVFTAGCYFCVLLLSAVNRSVPSAESWQGLVRALLGPVERLPGWLKLLLPFVMGVLFWLGAGPLLTAIGVQIPVSSFGHRLQEALLIGIGAWLSWKWLIAFVIVLHIITTYVYLGSSPFWKYVTDTARNLLRPLAAVPLRVGRFDFVPVVALAIMFALAEFLGSWLPKMYAKLPL